MNKITLLRNYELLEVSRSFWGGPDPDLGRAPGLRSGLLNLGVVVGIAPWLLGCSWASLAAFDSAPGLLGCCSLASGSWASLAAPGLLLLGSWAPELPKSWLLLASLAAPGLLGSWALLLSSWDSLAAPGLLLLSFWACF